MPWSPSSADPYPGIGDHWKARFGGRVQRIGLDPGFPCPHRSTSGAGGCVFCEPTSFVATHVVQHRHRPVVEQLQAGMLRMKQRGITRFAAYFQPRTNTNAPLPTLKRVWDAVVPFPEVVALCVGTRPDCVADPVLDLLAGYRERFEVWLELGLQSSHDRTLEILNRGHKAEQFADACRRARRRELLICAHVILGLPGEDVADEAATAEFLFDLGVEGVKLHHLAVVRGTMLEERWRRGEVELLNECGYAERAASFIRRLAPGTVLHRVVGDTGREHLLAPHFNKGRVAAEIRRRLVALGAPGGE